jgi:hypothetical protein
MTVGEVLEYNKGVNVIVEVHWKEVQQMYGYDVDAYVTKTSAYDDLSKYSDRTVKYIHCCSVLAPIYSLLDTVNGTSTETPLRVIQCYT